MVPFNALVIVYIGRESNFRFVAEGTITHTDLAWVVIHSEFFNSMPSTETAEVELAITAIIGQRIVSEWNDEKLEQIFELLAPYERSTNKSRRCVD